MKALGTMLATAATMVVSATLLVMPGTAQADSSHATRKAYSCPSGYVCLYTGAAGTGQRCYTDISIQRWTTASCNTVKFSSYFNNGTSAGGVNHVHAFTKYSYAGDGYHLLRGEKGRLASDANPRGISLKSLKWTSS